MCVFVVCFSWIAADDDDDYDTLSVIKRQCAFLVDGRFVGLNLGYWCGGGIITRFSWSADWCGNFGLIIATGCELRK